MAQFYAFTCQPSITSFITEAALVEPILTHIGEATNPPPIAPVNGPPAWKDGFEPPSDWDATAQPDPEFEFVQRVS